VTQAGEIAKAEKEAEKSKAGAEEEAQTESGTVAEKARAVRSRAMGDKPEGAAATEAASGTFCKEEDGTIAEEAGEATTVTLRQETRWMQSILDNVRSSGSETPDQAAANALIECLKKPSVDISHLAEALVTSIMASADADGGLALRNWQQTAAFGDMITKQHKEALGTALKQKAAEKNRDGKQILPAQYLHEIDRLMQMPGPCSDAAKFLRAPEPRFAGGRPSEDHPGKEPAVLAVRKGSEYCCSSSSGQPGFWSTEEIWLNPASQKEHTLRIHLICNNDPTHPLGVRHGRLSTFVVAPAHMTTSDLKAVAARQSYEETDNFILVADGVTTLVDSWTLGACGVTQNAIVEMWIVVRDRDDVVRSHRGIKRRGGVVKKVEEAPPTPPGAANLGGRGLYAFFFSPIRTDVVDELLYKRLRLRTNST